MPATVWSAVRQRQPTGKRVSQWPAKPVKLVFLGVYRNVTRGKALNQFYDQKRVVFIVLTAISVTHF